MISTSRGRWALATTGIASLVLASTVTAGAASTSGVYNAAAAKLVPSAYQHTTLQVATDASYPPDESISGSKMVGFDVDLMNAIAKTLGIKIHENNVTFGIIIAGIQGGRYAIGNSSFTDEKSREKNVNFVDYFTAGEGIYAKASSTLKFTSLKSLCGLTVAVETGTTDETDGTTAAKSCPSSKKMTIATFSNQNEANSAVLAGRAAVGFVDSQVAGYIVAQTHGNFKLVGKAINVAPYGLATSKTPNGAALAKAIQAALKVMIANGSYGAILKHWGVQSGALTADKIVLNGALS